MSRVEGKERELEAEEARVQVLRRAGDGTTRFVSRAHGVKVCVWTGGREERKESGRKRATEMDALAQPVFCVPAQTSQCTHRCRGVLVRRRALAAALGVQACLFAGGEVKTTALLV